MISSLKIEFIQKYSRSFSAVVVVVPAVVKNEKKGRRIKIQLVKKGDIQFFKNIY